VLEYAIGQLDVDSGGGGLEAHQRLTTGTPCRGTDNATTMRRARETLLSLAPQGFPFHSVLAIIILITEEGQHKQNVTILAKV